MVIVSSYCVFASIGADWIFDENQNINVKDHFKKRLPLTFVVMCVNINEC